MIEYRKPPLPLNVQRWSQLMRKLGVVKGDNVVSEVHQQVFPVIVLEDDRPEHKFAAGERLAFGQYLYASPGVGVAGYVGLQNPANSGIILIIENIQCRNQNNALRPYYISLARGAVVTVRNTEQARDTRWQPTGAFGTAAPSITGQIMSARGDTIVVTPFPIAEAMGFAYGVASSGLPYHMPIVLAPGDQIFVHESDGTGGTATNVAVQASFAWRERNLEPGET